MTSATTISTSAALDLRADALLASFERAGYARVAAGDPAAGGAVPRSFRRGHPQAHVSDHRSAGTRIVPAPRPHHPGLARLSRLARGRQAGQASAISVRSFAIAREPGRIPAGRHRILGRRDIAAADAEMLALGLDATAHYGLAAPDIRIGDVALFSALVAALDLAPAWKRRLIKDFNHKTSLAQDLDRLTISASQARPEYQGRARRARRLRPQSGACAGHGPALDRRHHRGRRALGRRDRRPLSRAGGAWRANLAAAGNPRADREIPGHQRRSRRSGGRAARLYAATPRSRSMPRSTCSRAAPAFSPRAASTSDASGSPPPSAAASTITPASCSSCTTRATADGRTAGGGRPL